ncbi:GntR family transcriptional regulator [Paenibacillus sp.]|uniref:GntR family transcriptional regulator n=1 Tax=Paenibacillus sp. TaxID=58172 RepID=UPI002D2F2EC9|nr:GntR family transcriptional regulator [Paenibacillus sp.]HZG88109.1 GntR family transcriptional regulator [Paenibacillus sp.]
MSPYPFKKPKASLLREQISDEIRQAILTGLIKPGDKLRELDIAEQMGVSRSSVREALLLLKQEGLVVTRPYKDTVVVQYSAKEIVEVLLPVRLTIELYAVRHGLPNMTEQDAAAFAGYTDKMKDALKHGKQEAKKIILENDIAFHNHLVKLCDSDNIHTIWAGIVNPIRLHFVERGKYDDYLTEIQHAEHRQLLDLFLGGDIEKIQEVLREHITGEYAAKRYNIDLI